MVRHNNNCVKVLTFVVFACIVIVAQAAKIASNLEELISQNNNLKELNMKLKQLVHEKVGSMKIVNRLANSPTFLELQEPKTSGGSNSGASESSPKKKCVEIDNMAGVGEAENNFCLAPDMCRETLYSCKRNCVNRCWVDKYSKNGAPPGFGDIDQTRLNVINQRVKQMLQQVNIDLDCKPCSGTKESKPAPKAITIKPKAKPIAVQRKVEAPKGGDAEGDVKLGFIEEPSEDNNNNSTISSNNTISSSTEPTYGPKYTVISTNYRDDPQEVRKQQLEKENLDNKTHAENLKHLMLEDDKIKCASCNGNKLLTNNNNKVN